ncbi:MAG: ABC transporter substrate-binding protein [Candidatus Dadabacteria bacterium]|nr:ABC transporter substrate-binding protein [Candidatus Dadabacteria bacterium]NIQ15002.1 ABC transporter substrate-binding protein [Candidatus Dadabacteria bacterium]
MLIVNYFLEKINVLFSHIMPILKYLILNFLILIFSGNFVGSQEVDNEDPIEIKNIIGCILPLSGENALLGERVMRGVEIAVSTSDHGDDYELFVKNIGNNKLDVINSYKELVVNSRPSFILGPVRTQAVQIVSNLVTKHRVPTITFPVFRDSSESSPYLVKFYYPIDDQIKYLADYSIKTLKLKRFAVIYPKTKLGDRFKDKFVEYSKRQGARIVHVGAYNTDLSDIDVEISWIKSFKPDAILIPDYPSRSAKIIKKILSDKTYLNVLFMGPNTWNSNAFAKLAGDDIDGLLHKAIFTDYLLIGSTKWNEFYINYKKTFNDEPGLFEYQVYEIVKKLISLSQNVGKKKYKLITNLMNLKGKGEFNVSKTKYGLEIYPKPHLISLEDRKLIKLQ